jgi:N-methylhydantoinase A/oxoprolinase/acetone carboxylase beta subunit
MRTTGLGGDSEVHLKTEGLLGGLRLGPRRLIPVALLAADHGKMVHDTLDRALSSDTAGEFDGRFVVPMAGQTGGLTAREAAVLARISEPMPMARALSSRLEVAALERLVARGLVMIAGVTPSDASHVLGRLDAWDGTASEKAVRLLGRRRNGAGDRFAANAETLAHQIIDQLTAQTVDCLLEAAFDEDPAFDGQDTGALARHPLTKAGLSQHRGVLEISTRLGVPVIGLGASAPSYYGAVGERLGCQMILPEHAGVANAIGAVVGQVSQRAQALLSSPSEGRFTAHLPDGLLQFNDRDTALAALEAALTTEATSRARTAGAEDLRITVARDIREASIEGRTMFIEATVTVTATGRPRVAHATAQES